MIGKSSHMLTSSPRVLDFANERGLICGKILGDLGADVIKVEKPDGDPSRRIGPFYNDVLHLERSLYWFAFNNNKRGITLNIETKDGQDIAKKLVKNAAIIVESFDPGYMDSLGLGYETLSEINPGVIMVSITPFGQKGPYKNYKASDIVVMAMGGFMSICGDADRPPVIVGIPQACLHAGAEGAVGAMIAYYYREKTGNGMQVDISMQESVAVNLTMATAHWQMKRVIQGRYGAYRMLSSRVLQRTIWPCKDGFIAFSIHGGLLGAPGNRALIKMMSGEEVIPNFLKEMDWDHFDVSSMNEEAMKLFEDLILKFFVGHTKKALYELAIENRIILYPVSNSKDLLENIQLNERDFWVEVEHPELEDSIVYPGAWIKSSETPMNIRRRAPLIGEHNEEIYTGELGISKDDLRILKQSGVI